MFLTLGIFIISRYQHLRMDKVSSFRVWYARIHELMSNGMKRILFFVALNHSSIRHSGVSQPVPVAARPKSAIVRLLVLRFRILPEARISALFNVACCQVEVCATERTLLQKIPTECGVSWGWTRNLNNETALFQVYLLRQKRLSLGSSQFSFYLGHLL
jgi:hypothetical protein